MALSTMRDLATPMPTPQECVSHEAKDKQGEGVAWNATKHWDIEEVISFGRIPDWLPLATVVRSCPR